ncbi:acyl carrier protein [Pseudomonas moorei]|jgi:hypothetical protein|nr:acyl carrier protein [Pseudomonas moorei]
MLKQEISEILRIPTSKLDVTRPLQELGLDSLTSSSRFLQGRRPHHDKACHPPLKSCAAYRVRWVSNVR